NDDIGGGENSGAGVHVIKDDESVVGKTENVGVRIHDMHQRQNVGGRGKTKAAHVDLVGTLDEVPDRVFIAVTIESEDIGAKAAAQHIVALAAVQPIVTHAAKQGIISDVIA